MLTLDPTFKTALSKSTLTLCYCWLITRNDGGQLGFTSLDVSFVIDGVTYQGVTGFDPTASQYSQGLDSVDSQNVKGILEKSGISSNNIQAGLLDYAEVRRFIVDYTNLPSSLSLNPPKHRELPRSYFGSITRDNLGYDIQLKDEFSKLDNNIGETTSKTCRATLGDDRCRKDLTNHTHNLNISEITNRRVFKVLGTQSDNKFARGRLQFFTGKNAGIVRDIGLNISNQIILHQPAPFDLNIGDSIVAVEGCMGTKYQCIVRFNNFRRFVGEPDIPVTDLAINTPSS
jgi:uncharacterized phage protein (TIGR02218 family)